jgi:hypothetical protein
MTEKENEKISGSMDLRYVPPSRTHSSDKKARGNPLQFAKSIINIHVFNSFSISIPLAAAPQPLYHQNKDVRCNAIFT